MNIVMMLTIMKHVFGMEEIVVVMMLTQITVMTASALILMMMTQENAPAMN